jgi:hypothetical protein
MHKTELTDSGLRADSLRLEGRLTALLVQCARPGRCVADQEAAQERSSSNHEARGVDGARGA